MANVDSPQNALFQYFDSLLSDNEGKLRSIPIAQPLEIVQVPMDAAVDAMQAPDHEVDPDVLRLISFKVANVPLAINQNDVLSVVDKDGDAISNTGTGDGMIRMRLEDRGREIGILDLREIIFPSEHPARHTDGTVAQAHILVLRNGECGLLCDAIIDSLNVAQQGVEWRSRRTSRPWLAGMVKDFNCALLDATELAHIYERLTN